MARWIPQERGKCIAEAERWGRWYAPENEILGFLYRFDYKRYSYIVDAEREEYSSYAVLELYAYPVKKWTPHGATLHCYSGTRHKFVNLEATKRFAWKTVDEALESFIARKKKEISIYESRIAEALRGIEAAESFYEMV